MRAAVSFLLMSGLLMAGCKNSTPGKTSRQVYETVQTALINASPGDVIDVPAGTWDFSRALSLVGVEDVTLRGQGMEETILNFGAMQGGAEGIKVQDADGATLEGFTVQNTPGDGIKVIDADGAVIRHVKVEWTAGPDSAHGGYGLYPVSVDSMLIEENEVHGASDAGIYLGQSTNSVIRNNLASGNVQGIAVENCTNVEVYGNTARGNTSGISIYNLPNLPVASGQDIRIHDNRIVENNHLNFGAEGAIVHMVPAGTGLFVLAGIDVEIYDNTFSEHRTTGTGVISYPMTGRPLNDETYYPFSRGVSIHDNTYQPGTPALPDTTRRMGRLIAQLFQTEAPEIIYDGIRDPSRSRTPPSHAVCISDNENARFANLNAPSDFQQVSFEEAPFRCTPDAAPASTSRR